MRVLRSQLDIETRLIGGFFAAFIALLFMLVPPAHAATGDGSGTLNSSLAVVTVGSGNPGSLLPHGSGPSILLTFHGDGVNDLSGGTVSVTVPNGWSPPQTDRSDYLGYLTVEAGGGTVTTSGQAILVNLPGDFGSGGSVQIRYGTVSAGDAVQLTVGTAVFLTETAVTGGTLTPVANSPAIEVAPAIVVNPTLGGGNATAGIPVSFSAFMMDANRNVVESYQGTVQFTSSDGRAILPPDYTFSPLDLGEHVFPVTFILETGSSVTVTDVARPETHGTSPLMNILPGPAAVFRVSGRRHGDGFGQEWPAGTLLDVSVEADDAYGNPASYQGPHTITVSSTATNSPNGVAPTIPYTVPTNVSFTAGNAVLIGFSLTNAGETPTISVTDGAISGSAAFPVDTGPADPASTTATVPDGVTAHPTSISVRAAFDVYGNPATMGGSTVVVTVSGANTNTATAVDNGDGTYTATYWPINAGVDSVAIAVNGAPIGGSPYTSTVTAPAAMPVVTGINPNSGSELGGTTVDVSGSGFAGTTGVAFGLAAAPSFIVNSDTSLTVTSPPGHGTVDVKVTTPAGISTVGTGDLFTYTRPPTMTAIVGSGQPGTVYLDGWIGAASVRVDLLDAPGGAVVETRSTSVDGFGSGQVGFGPTAFAPGEQLVASSTGEPTKTLDLAALSIQGSLANNVLTGFGPPSTTLDIALNCTQSGCAATGRVDTALSDGSFTFDLTGKTQLVVGSGFSASFPDADDDRMQAQGFIPQPPSVSALIAPSGGYDAVSLWGWGSSTTVHLDLFASPTDTTPLWSATAPISGGSGFVDVGSRLFTAGQRLEASDGTWTKQLDIVPFTIQADAATDVVSGSGPPSTDLRVNVNCDRNGCAVSTDVRTGGDGSYAVDLHGRTDVAPGSSFSASFGDADGDRLEVQGYLSVPAPSTVTAVVNSDGVPDQIYLGNWPKGATVHVELLASTNGPAPLQTWDLPIDGNGFAQQSLPPGTLAPGQQLTATTAGGPTKQLEIVPLTIQADLASDILSGSGPPLSWLRINVNCSQTCPVSQQLQTDANGAYSLDVSSSVDLGPGSSFSAVWRDDDGDAVQAQGSIPLPTITAFIGGPNGSDALGLWGWPAGGGIHFDLFASSAEATLLGSWDAVADPSGGGRVDLGRGVLAPGQRIVATQPGWATKRLDVVPLSVQIDVANDVISGSGPPLANVFVSLCVNSTCPVQQPLTIGADGLFALDLAGQFDIGFGAGANVSLRDSDGDNVFASAYASWPTVTAIIGASGQPDGIALFGWPGGATVHVDLFGSPADATPVWSSDVVVDGGGMAITTLSGNVFVSGQRLVASVAGVEQKALDIVELTIQADAATDVISGFGPPNTSLQVVANCSPTSCVRQDVSTAPDGSFSLDVSGLTDIAPGSTFSVSLTDADFDSEQASGYIPTPPPPRLRASVRRQYFGTSNFVGPVTATITDGSGVTLFTDTRAPDAGGDVQWQAADFPFALRPGMTVTATDGVTTRSLVVVDFSLGFWPGGSVDDLVASAAEHGAGSVLVMVDGSFVAYIPGAPSFVNKAFVDAFPDGVPAGTQVEAGIMDGDGDTSMVFLYPGDRDLDAIEDAVDAAPDAASATFGDATTSGHIVDAGGLTISVFDAPRPDGVRLSAAGPAGTTATISMCDGAFTVSLTAGNEATLTCGSLTSQVVSGPITVVAAPGVVVSVPTGTTAKLEPTAATVQVTNLAGTDPVTVTSDGVTTTVTAGASATVDVSPRSLKTTARADLAGSGASGKRVGKVLDDLARSLAPSLWVDSYHLVVKHGDHVFDAEAQAVHELAKAAAHGEVDAALAGSVTDRLVAADRLLASTAIAESPAPEPGKHGDEAHGASGAAAHLAKGDALAASGKAEQAIHEYREAWKGAVRGPQGKSDGPHGEDQHPADGHGDTSGGGNGGSHTGADGHH